MKLIIVLIVFIQNTFAVNCPSARSLNDIAKDVITLDLEGVRYDEISSNCLKQEDYKHALIVRDISNDIAPSLKYLVEKEKDYKILEIKLLDKEIHSYEVTVEYKVFDIEKKTNLDLKERYTFFLYKDEVARNNYGCFGILNFPENIYLFKKCQR